MSKNRSTFYFAFRCSAPIALNALNSEELLIKMIQHSISRAWRLGKAVLDARKHKTSTLSAIIEHENAKILCIGKVVCFVWFETLCYRSQKLTQGCNLAYATLPLFTFKIVDVERKTTGGFARGMLIIEGFEEFQGKNLIINFQNEFLVAKIKDSTGTEKVFPSSAVFHGVKARRTKNIVRNHN